jgi:hypothetical protein
MFIFFFMPYFLFMISLGMSEHVRAGPLWAWLGMKVMVLYGHVQRLMTVGIHLLQVH